MDENHHAEQMVASVDVQTLWESQQLAYQQLLWLRYEPASKVYDPKALARSVTTAPTIVTCVDERALLPNDQPRIAIAGSGVLLSSNQMIAFAKSIKGLATEITAHEVCGACALSVEQTGSGLDPIMLGRQAAQQLKELIGLKGGPPLIGYSDQVDWPMAGSPQFHSARAIVVDGSGRFNPRGLGLPSAFEHSVRYYPDWDYAATELDVIIGIALGGHGFGPERFKEEPLIVAIVSGEPGSGYTATEIEKVLRAVANSPLEQHADVTTVVHLNPFAAA